VNQVSLLGGLNYNTWKLPPFFVECFCGISSLLLPGIGHSVSEQSAITVKAILPWWVSDVMDDIIISIIDTAASFHYDVCPSANKMLQSIGKHQ